MTELVGAIELSASSCAVTFHDSSGLMSGMRSGYGGPTGFLVEGWVKEIHETGGTVSYLFIGMHAAAALFHHYFVRDNTLLRMLPTRK